MAAPAEEPTWACPTCQCVQSWYSLWPSLVNGAWRIRCNDCQVECDWPFPQFDPEQLVEMLRECESAWHDLWNCPHCGHDNDRGDVWRRVDAQGQYTARCKECPHAVPWPFREPPTPEPDTNDEAE